PASAVTEGVSFWATHHDIASYEIAPPLLQTEHVGRPSVETRRVEDKLTEWYVRHMQGLSFPARRGRPPGTGTFASAEEFAVHTETTPICSEWWCANQRRPCAPASPFRAAP